MSERAPEDRIIDFEGRDQARIDEHEKDADFRRAQRHAVVTRILSDSVAREWLWDLLQEFGTFSVTFAASPTGFPDPMATSYYQGRQSCGWRIWTELDGISPQLASLMRREHQGTNV
jgi:hypothetical protein